MAPGESTVVELIFKTKNYRTKINKYATIYSNDPTQSTAKIHLSADVYTSTDTTLPIALLPEKVDLSQGTEESKIVLKNLGEAKIRIEETEEPLEGLSIKIKNDDPKPGEESELQFEWKDDFQKENIEKSLTFLASGEGANTFRFSIPVFVHGTDPSKPATAARSKSKPAPKPSVTGSKTVRRPIPRRATTKAEDPKAASATGAQKTETNSPAAVKAKSQILEKKLQDSESDDSVEKTEKESEQNQ